MTLALRLGRTLAELKSSMSASEMQLWFEYDSISPIGDVRGDVRNAQLVSAIFGSQGHKVNLPDAMLQWGADSEEESDPFAALEAALMAAAQ